ncbi:MAG TPA: hypothetical protein VGJ50_14425 [Streptosporangiaceae bacterium]
MGIFSRKRREPAGGQPPTGDQAGFARQLQAQAMEQAPPGGRPAAQGRLRRLAR